MTRTETPHLDELARQAADGDRAALNQLLHLIRPMVVRFCQHRMSGELGTTTADDIVQEVLLSLCSAIEGWQPEKRVMAFVFTIAAHKVIDAHRSASRDRSEPTDTIPEAVDTHPSPEQVALEAAHSAEVQRLLAVLPDHYREVLELRVGLGLTAEETARHIGSTAGAVRVAQHRAMRAIRTHLNTTHARPSICT